MAPQAAQVVKLGTALVCLAITLTPPFLHFTDTVCRNPFEDGEEKDDLVGSTAVVQEIVEQDLTMAELEALVNDHGDGVHDTVRYFFIILDDDCDGVLSGKELSLIKMGFGQLGNTEKLEQEMQRVQSTPGELTMREWIIFFLGSLQTSAGWSDLGMDSKWGTTLDQILKCPMPSTGFQELKDTCPVELLACVKECKCTQTMLPHPGLLGITSPEHHAVWNNEPTDAMQKMEGCVSTIDTTCKQDDQGLIVPVGAAGVIISGCNDPYVVHVLCQIDLQNSFVTGVCPVSCPGHVAEGCADKVPPAPDFDATAVLASLAAGGSCVDRGPDCNTLQLQSAAFCDRELIQALCPVTCGVCEESAGVDDECVDDDATIAAGAAAEGQSFITSCAQVEMMCTNAEHKEKMKIACPKTCGYCSSEEKVETAKTIELGFEAAEDTETIAEPICGCGTDPGVHVQLAMSGTQLMVTAIFVVLRRPETVKTFWTNMYFMFAVFCNLVYHIGKFTYQCGNVDEQGYQIAQLAHLLSMTARLLNVLILHFLVLGNPKVQAMAKYGLLRRIFQAEIVLVVLIFCLNIPIFQWQQLIGKTVFVMLAIIFTVIAALATQFGVVVVRRLHAVWREMQTEGDVRIAKLAKFQFQVTLAAMVAGTLAFCMNVAVFFDYLREAEEENTALIFCMYVGIFVRSVASDACTHAMALTAKRTDSSDPLTPVGQVHPIKVPDVVHT
jgi:hypothetical protein